MTRDDIIKLAREAGFITGVTHASSGYSHPFVHPVAFPTCLVELERFAALVAAAEREACIEACEASYHWINGPEGWLKYAVEAIQSRSNQ